MRITLEQAWSLFRTLPPSPCAFWASFRALCSAASRSLSLFLLVGLVPVKGALVLTSGSCWVLAAPSRAPFPSPSLREEGARFSAQRRSEMSILDREERRAADPLPSIVDNRKSNCRDTGEGDWTWALSPAQDPSKSVFLKGKCAAFSYRENRRMDRASLVSLVRSQKGSLSSSVRSMRHESRSSRLSTFRHVEICH